MSESTQYLGLPPPPASGAAMLPMGTYEGKTVFITGGGTGLGKAMAVEFARLGANIVIASRNADHQQAGLRAVEAEGAKAIAITLDVRDQQQVSSAFDAATQEFGNVDVLINNAAGNFAVPAEDLTPNGWRSVTAIVLDGTFFCSTEFARRCIAAHRPGSILNILVAYTSGGAPGHSHSAAAKAGVLSLTSTLAVEWAPQGIRVNALSPGIFPHDDHSGDMLKQRPEGYSAEWRRIPALRTGCTQELGWAATYLCSPYAAYVTGMDFTIDGGERLRRSLRMPAFVPIRDQLAGGAAEPSIQGARK